MKPQRMLFVFNPNSGKAQIPEHLFSLVDLFTKGGYLVTLHPTQCQRDATEVICQHCTDFDLVVVAGGDGTLNESICGLLERKNQGANIPPLGYLPAGTVNDFATSLEIPKELEPAAKTVLEGMPFCCDIGKFGDSYFTYVAAFGAFTSVSYETPQQSKNLLGRPAYLLEGLRQLPTIHPYHMQVECDGVITEGDFIFGMVSNSKSVGGFSYPHFQEISMEDGKFELLLIRQPESLAQLQSAINALLRREDPQQLIVSAKASHFRFLSQAEAPWTLDGEFGGIPTEVEITNLRQAVRVIVPRSTEQPSQTKLLTPSI